MRSMTEGGISTSDPLAPKPPPPPPGCPPREEWLWKHVRLMRLGFGLMQPSCADRREQA